ncbi:MAG: hypothetical protein WC803_10035 [Sphingomonas sp.]|jgi:hypothetical protein
MKPPSPTTYVLASPPVFFGSWALSCWLLYQWSRDGGIWPLIVAMGLFLLAVMKADERVKAYKAWQREWEGLDGASYRSSRKGAVAATVVVVAVPTIYALAQLPPQTQNVATLLLVLAVAGFFLLRALRRGVGPRPRTRKAEIVTVVVTAPLFPVPSMADAYRALPDHCRRMG